MSATRSGTWLGHEVRGEAGKPLLVFLHGFMGDRHDWDEILPEFESTHRCLATDYPGHGDTKTPSDSDYTFDGAGAELINLVDSLGADSFSLVGYSMGGRFALHLASMFSMRIDKLVLESASPGIRDKNVRAQRLVDDSAVAKSLRFDYFHQFLDRWYRQPIFASLEAQPDLRDALIQRRRLKNRPSELARALLFTTVGLQQPHWESLPEHHIPTLVMAGELDEKYAGIAQEMGALCSAMRVTIVPGCGHCVHLEDTAAYTRLLKDFLL